MKNFIEYVAEKGLGDLGAEITDEKSLFKALKYALSHHNEKVLEFLRTLSENDENIRRFLSQYKDSRNNNFLKKYPDTDVISVPSSDG